MRDDELVDKLIAVLGEVYRDLKTHRKLGADWAANSERLIGNTLAEVIEIRAKREQ